MSEAAKELFASLKETVQAIAPGLKDLVPEMKAEMSRLGTQGAMELTSALFTGSAFVPYGPGQYTPSVEAEQTQAVQEQGLERGGMER